MTRPHPVTTYLVLAPTGQRPLQLHQQRVLRLHQVPLRSIPSIQLALDLRFHRHRTRQRNIIRGHRSPLFHVRSFLLLVLEVFPLTEHPQEVAPGGWSTLLGSRRRRVALAAIVTPPSDHRDNPATLVLHIFTAVTKTRKLFQLAG